MAPPSQASFRSLARRNSARTIATSATRAIGLGASVMSAPQDAAVQYQRVLDFLPDSDPCYAIAKQRLAQIKR